MPFDATVVNGSITWLATGGLFWLRSATSGGAT